MTAKPSNETPSTVVRTPNATITARGDAWTRRVAVVGVVVVAIAAAVLSFQALMELAIDQGYDRNLAFLFPVAVDGMMLSAAMVTTHGAMRGVRLAWAYAATALGALLSVYGNVVHAWDGSVTSVIVHAVPPLFMLIGIEMALYLTRMRLSEQAVQEEAKRVAEAKALRAQERAEQRALKASVGAPTRKPASKPAKKSQPARTDLNEERVAKVSALINTEDFATATADMSNPEIAAYVLASVPGITASEAVKGGLMAQEDDKGRTHYMRVQRAFKKAQERAGEGAPVTSPTAAPASPVQRLEAPNAGKPVNSESIAPERVLTAVGAR